MAPNPNPKTRERERLDDLIDWAGEHADEGGSYLADVFHHLTELRLRRYQETGDQEVVRGINGNSVVGVLLGDGKGPRVFSIEGRPIVGVVLGPQSPVQEGGRLFVSADGSKQVRESINPQATAAEKHLDFLIDEAGVRANDGDSYLTDVLGHLMELRIRRKNDWETEDLNAAITLTANPDGSATDPKGPDVDVHLDGQSIDREFARRLNIDTAYPIHLDPADDDLYEPGRFACGNCDFTMGVSVIIHGMDGIERAGVLPREMLDNPPLCPRCHEAMHRVSWRKQAEFYQRCLVNAQEDIAAFQESLKQWRENAAGNRDVLNRLNAEIDKAEVRVGRIRDDYDRACQTIAAMHKATTGLTRGPIRGVVEDVEDLGDLVDGFAEYIMAGQVPQHTAAQLLNEYKRLRGPHMEAARQGSTRAQARGRELGLVDDDHMRGAAAISEDGPR